MKLRNKITRLAQAPVEKFLDWISIPIWFVDFLTRNKTVRGYILWFTAFSIGVITLFGTGIYLMGLMTIGQMALSLAMMIGQFVVLFSFLSNSKTIELYPGQEGLFTFEKDYFGNRVLVSATREWISSLEPKGKQHLDEMGAESIHGILFQGPPGTGKSLLAQCLASESRAAFFGITGADMTSMFIGVAPLKIMRMYSKARKAAARFGAAIVFIDELDAIGGNRGGVSGTDNGRSGTTTGGLFGGGGLGVLSKLLTELDGVKEVGRRFQIINALRRRLGIPEIAQGLVLTIGATNRLGSLDPALLRPGRIDKIIEIPQPDKESRRLIIEGYLRKVQHDASTIDIPGMVEDTAGVSPAQLASVIQRSAPRYAMNDKRLYITQSDIDQAFQEDLVGLANRIVDWDRKQKKSVSVHEAGHAMVAYLVRGDKRITTVSIVRRGAGILGYVRDVEKKEVFAMPLERISANMMVALAGHYAAELIMGEPWTGATSDFEHVRFYLYQLAMAGRFGGIPFQMGATNNDPFMSERLRERADQYLQESIQGTKKLLKENEGLLTYIAAGLMQKEELTSRQFYTLIKRYNSR